MRAAFRGGGRGDGRGRNLSRGGGRGGRSSGGRFERDEGPPSEIVEAGQVSHECESELICKWTLEGKVPYFNAGVFLENKRKIGKVDEILGKIAEYYITIKMDPGVLAKSFQPCDLVYIGTDKLLPLSRFTDPGKPSGRGAGRVGGTVYTRYYLGTGWDVIDANFIYLLIHNRSNGRSRRSRWKGRG
jgi:H/ACA ribonucleoprotein complex subunit 1